MTMIKNSTQQALDSLLIKRDMTSTSHPPSSSSPAIPGGETGYEPTYPNNIPVDSAVKEFVTHFFEVSDDPDRNDEWADLFREDATVVMGTDVARGREEIRELRKRMWKDVEARKHRLAKVFPGSFSDEPGAVAVMDEAEFMLFGAVAYRLRDGKGDAAVEWAGHAQLRRDGVGKPWRLGYYRVYIQR